MYVTLWRLLVCFSIPYIALYIALFCRCQKTFKLNCIMCLVVHFTFHIMMPNQHNYYTESNILKGILIVTISLADVWSTYQLLLNTNTGIKKHIKTFATEYTIIQEQWTQSHQLYTIMTIKNNRQWTHLGLSQSC